MMLKAQVLPLLQNVQEAHILVPIRNFAEFWQKFRNPYGDAGIRVFLLAPFILNCEKKYSLYTCHKKYKKLIVILLTTPVSYWKVLLYSERKITESYAKTVHVVIYFFFFVIFSSTMPLTRKRKSNKRLCTKVAKASS